MGRLRCNLSVACKKQKIPSTVYRQKTPRHDFPHTTPPPYKGHLGEPTDHAQTKSIAGDEMCILAAVEEMLEENVTPPLTLKSLAASTRAGLLLHFSDMKASTA